MSEHAEMIADCISRESKMSDWETNFVDAVQYYDYLTPKQMKVLERIWEKVTKEG